MSDDLRVRIYAAPSIGSESWLQDDEYEEFRRGYGYAATQTRAIPGLSAMTPEDAYYVWWAIDRGIQRHQSRAVAAASPLPKENG